MKKKSPYKIIITIIVWLLGLAAIGAVIFFAYRLYANRPNEQTRIHRVGILSGLSVFDDTVNGFKAQMSELGYVEGKNIAYDVQKFEKLDQAAYETAVKKFIDEKVNLILAFPTEAAFAAKAMAAESGIPIVFAHSFTDGVGLAGSGGNVTGVRLNGAAISTQSLNIFLKIVPQVRRVWVPYQKDFSMITAQITALRSLSQTAGVTLVELPAADAADLKTKLERNENLIDKKGEDVFLLVAEPLTTAPGALSVIYDFSAKNEMPVGGIVMAGKDNDVVFGVNPERTLVGKQTAVIADRILKGTPAEIIPVVDSKNYMQINLPAADKFGLKIGEDLISSADQVIR